MDRLDSLLLAAVGVLIVHQIAYTSSAVFGVETSGAHGHLAFAWFGGSIALLGALARAISVSLKKRQHDAGHVGVLASAIGVGYLAMELIERLVDGQGATTLFTEPVLWFGMALAPLVAIALHWSVRSVVERALEFLTPAQRTWTATTTSPLQPFFSVEPAFARIAVVVSRRGPPVQ